MQARMFAHGRVQGIGFRYHVNEYATGLGLHGYVRNLHDGRVEILAQGSQENIQKIINYVRSSPGFSHVIKLDIDWEELLNGLSSFHVRF